MTDAPYLSPPLEIESHFRDYNDHVNMAYHVVLADKAVDHAYAEIKGADYVDAYGMTTFAAEVHVRYVREMNMDDEIRGRVRFANADEKRLHWVVELIRGSDGETVTTVEGVTLSVSVESRKVEPFPADVLERLQAAVARDGPGAAALDWVGRRVGMSK